MKITKIEIFPFSIRLKKVIAWASGSLDRLDHLVVKIHGEDGFFGVSEAIPRPMIYGETQQSIYYATRDQLAPLLVGEDSFALDKIWRKLARVAGNLAAKGALDIALHDLNGKQLQIPVHRLLGGKVRDSVDLVWMVSLMPESQMLDEALSRAAQGFRSFKVKGGMDPAADIRVMHNMRKHLGEEVQLYVDANTMYDRETARRVMHALEDVIDCVEEPMAVHDDIGRLDLARNTRVPILGDDSIFTFQDVSRELALGALSRMSIKLPRSGFWNSRRIVSLCEAHSVALQINTQGETSLGTSACLQLAGAFSQISHPCELTYYLDATDSIIEGDPVIVDGRMLIGDEPGCGTNINWEKFKRYAVGI